MTDSGTMKQSQDDWKQWWQWRCTKHAYVTVQCIFYSGFAYTTLLNVYCMVLHELQSGAYIGNIAYIDNIAYNIGNIAWWHNFAQHNRDQHQKGGINYGWESACLLHRGHYHQTRIGARPSFVLIHAKLRIVPVFYLPTSNTNLLKLYLITAFV